MHNQPALTPGSIVQMASAYYASATLFAAIDANVFGALQDGGGTADDVAARSRVSPRGARLLLDACVALGLLTKDGSRYANAPAAALTLVPGAPNDLTRAIRYNRDVYPAWGKLPEFVRTGAPVEPPALHLGNDPERTRRFVLSMHGRALGIGRAVVPLLDLTGCRALLDLAGGPGTYAVLLAQANPALRCTVLDLPPVAKVADELIAQAGMSDRVHTLPGDYHSTPFPGNMDAVTIFGALHQESPDAIRDILGRACAALRPGGQIFILDLMTDASHTQPPFSALFAVNMALTTEHGWVFSDEEICRWLVEAGFTDCQVRPVPPPMPHWLASARKTCAATMPA
jgi:ubiquinone/menaquinone biosynthesis C-methylase UbiE